MRIRFVLGLVLVLVLVAGCSDQEAKETEAEALRLQAVAELESVRAGKAEQDDIMAILRTQAQQTSQIMAQAQVAGAQAAQAAAEASKLQAVAITAAGQGIRIPSDVGMLAIIMGGIIVIVLLLRRSPIAAQAPRPSPKGGVWLLPSVSDPRFNALLAEVGGRWDGDGRPIDARGQPVCALLEVEDE